LLKSKKQANEWQDFLLGFAKPNDSDSNPCPNGLLDDKLPPPQNEDGAKQGQPRYAENAFVFHICVLTF